MNNLTNVGNTRWFVLLILIATLITILVFITGKNLPDFFPSPTAVPSPIASPSPTSIASVSPTPNSQPAITANSLTGKWKASGQETFNAVSNIIFGSFIIDAPCNDGPICADVYIPNLPCSFYLSYLSKSNEKYYFEQKIKDGNCGTASLTYIQPLQNGIILFHSEGSFGVEDITLTR